MINGDNIVYVAILSELWNNGVSRVPFPRSPGTCWNL